MRIMTVFDSEAGYTESLARMLSQQKALPFEVRAFTDRKKMEAFLRARPVSLSLIAEKDFTQEMLSLPSERFVILSEDRGNPECAGLEKIGKYQPFPAVFSQILAIAARYAYVLPSSGALRGTQIIGVGSPLGRCGKTLFSLTLARLLADSRRTAFISLDPLSILPEILRTEDSASLSDLLFDLKTGRHGPPEKIPEICREWGPLSVLPPVRLPQDVFEMSPDDLLGLLEALGTACFETVIVDAGPLIFDPAPLLGVCTRFYMPVLPDPLSGIILRRFFGQTGRLPGAERDELRTVTLPTLPAGDISPDGLPDSLLFLPLSAFTMQLIRKEQL